MPSTTRLYHPGPLALNAPIPLTPDASHHLLSVLRARPSHPCILFNGDGIAYHGYLSDKQKKQAVVTLTDTQPETPSPLSIHLGQAISKSTRMDWAIQKAVELGVTHITPLITDHMPFALTTTQQTKRHAHWMKIMISACEQSGRCTLPVLSPPISLTEWLIDHNDILCCVCDQNGQDWPTPSTTPTTVAIGIGPEGGWSDKEKQCIADSSAHVIQLGPRTLRTETATAATLSIAGFLWGSSK